MEIWQNGLLMSDQIQVSKYGLMGRNILARMCGAWHCETWNTWILWLLFCGCNEVLGNKNGKGTFAWADGSSYQAPNRQADVFIADVFWWSRGKCVSIKYKVKLFSTAEVNQGRVHGQWHPWSSRLRFRICFLGNWNLGMFESQGLWRWYEQNIARCLNILSLNSFSGSFEWFSWLGHLTQTTH